MRLLRSGLSVVGVLALASVVLAQSRQPISLQEQRKMIVSARAGGVNLVEGDVTAKSGDADWALLVAGDELKSGTSVRTGANSRAEILLDPGSYLRLSSNSEFKFEDTSSDNLRLAVLRGSAIVEEGAAGHWRGTLAIVATPKAVFNIVRSGVYRFDVDENGAAQVEVQKGKLAVASGAAGSSDVLVPEGKKAVLASSSPEVAGFSKRDLDGFDAWSKDRAKSLVEANNTMVNPSVGPAFLAGAISPLYSGCGGWWAFDPFFGSSIYLPGGFDSCSSLFSPYGWYYGVCNYPTVGYGQEPGEGGTPAT
ncbi:MAG TPA: FecR family protein, partial [Blastocatellia bacterium]|nr:FecR family protein [Blastocatellia bacterium]